MEIHPSVKDTRCPRLCKPCCALQIFDTRVDFPIPAQVVVDSYNHPLSASHLSAMTLSSGFENGWSLKLWPKDDTQTVSL